MTLPHYLKALRLMIQDKWTKDPATLKAEVEKYDAKRKELEKKGAGANASDAKKFLKDSVGIIVRLLRREEVGGEADILSDASQVAKAISNEEGLLRLIGPDFSINPTGRWPGPVSYRSALNHLIAVSIRVHSMYPDTEFGVILRASARRILVPAIAHNLTFLRRNEPATFNALLKSGDGISRLLHKTDGGKLLDKTKVVVLEGEASTAGGQAWARLLNAAFNFARLHIKDDPEGLFEEIQRLTLEHEINPSGSALWNELSLIASGDLSIDELLVSRVTTDLQGKLGPAPPRPIVFCARARFGLLRYTYSMSDERELVAKHPAKALDDAIRFSEGIEGQKLKEGSCREAFGWAYLWSRYLLIGREDDKRMGTAIFKATQDKAGILLENLLHKVYLHAEEKEYKQLALRYITGFLTNPRFVRPSALRANGHTKAKDYLDLMRKESLPGGLISMMQARLSLHEAHALKGSAGFGKALDACLATYAETLKSISASEHSDSMMDGEVAAWSIPEMRYAVELLKETVTSKGNEKKRKIGELDRIQNALDMVGEMQFGVYFNQEEESGRLEKGLKLGCADLG
jgi:hypothetical protein